MTCAASSGEPAGTLTCKKRFGFGKADCVSGAKRLRSTRIRFSQQNVMKNEKLYPIFGKGTEKAEKQSPQRESHRRRRRRDRELDTRLSTRARSIAFPWIRPVHRGSPDPTSFHRDPRRSRVGVDRVDRLIPSPAAASPTRFANRPRDDEGVLGRPLGGLDRRRRIRPRGPARRTPTPDPHAGHAFGARRGRERESGASRGARRGGRARSVARSRADDRGDTGAERASRGVRRGRAVGVAQGQSPRTKPRRFVASRCSPSFAAASSAESSSPSSSPRSSSSRSGSKPRAR